MLPLALLALIQAQLIHAQQSTLSLPLNSLYNFTVSSTTKIFPIYSLPDSNLLSVSVALCANVASPPRFFVTNDTTITQPGPDDVDDPNVYEILLNNGLGQWTGVASNGGYLAVSSAGQAPFEIGVSDQGPLHTLDLDVNLPLLGDTTSNQALLFSPVIAPAPDQNTPQYPNYTLPAANLSYPVFPSSALNVTLSIIPTSSSSLQSLPLTGCALRASTADGTQNVGPKQSEGLWLRDQNGWRWQWMVSSLTPQTNYTMYAITNGTQVSGPINFVTKSASFSCPIVHSLPYCPSINYAAPLPPPPSTAVSSAYDANTLPSDTVDQLLQVLTNFTISLTTFPCGRDEYSPLVTCADCQQAYRKWLCAVWFPRCSEASPSAGSGDQNQAQTPVSALQAQAPSATPRSPGLQPFSSAYDVLLPCIETCTAVDRSCPYFMGFKCPVPRFNAASSYGVGFIDNSNGDQQGGGLTGAAQDRFGNVWCNEG